MVAAAQRAHGALNPLDPFEIGAVHNTVVILKAAFRLVVNTEPSWYSFLHVAVELNQIVAVDTLVERGAEHTATDVDSDQIRNNLVAKVRCEPDHATLSGVGVGHDANRGTLESRTRCNLVNLLLGALLKILSENL